MGINSCIWLEEGTQDFGPKYEAISANSPYKEKLYFFSRIWISRKVYKIAAVCVLNLNVPQLLPKKWKC